MDLDTRGQQHALDEKSFVEMLGSLPGDVVKSGDASKDLAISLALNDRLTNEFVSSRAGEIHRSVVGGRTNGGLTILDLTLKSAQGGPKPDPGPQAWGEAPFHGCTRGTVSPNFVTPPNHALSVGTSATCTLISDRTSLSAPDAFPAPPQRTGFFSNMDGFDPSWLVGLATNDTKLPMASDTEGESFQPETKSCFTCWKTIMGSREIAGMKPRGAVYVVLRGDVSGSHPDESDGDDGYDADGPP